MDPRRANGGTFLGLNGIAVKSHGGTDALGFASAVDLAYEMAESRLIDAASRRFGGIPSQARGDDRELTIGVRSGRSGGLRYPPIAHNKVE